MNEKILEDIQLDIRKNFNKHNNLFWKKIDITHYNCYMYVISNTIPTEMLDYLSDDQPFLRSVISYNMKFFFGDIGQISGKINFHNTEQLKEALKADLNVLGFDVKECTLSEKLDKRYKRIAFFYDLERLEKYGSHQNFHFLRQQENFWFHKRGWDGPIEKIKEPIEDFKADGLHLVGYFKIRLK